VSTHGFVELLSAAHAYKLRPHERIALRLLMRAPLQEVVDHAARIFALSPAEHPLLKQLRVPDAKIALVTNGVNPFYFGAPEASELAEVQRTFALTAREKDGPPVAMFLGNHTQNKGLDVLLEALLASSRPYLLIVAGKKRETINYAGYLARCRPGQRIIFTDSVSDQQVRALFHCADLFVFPSLADTLPLVVLEAMAAGLPVLATTVGGIPYQVDASCGRLVPPGDVEALRVAFEEFSTQRDSLRIMGAAARERVRERFDWSRSSDEAYRQFLSILSESAPR